MKTAIEILEILKKEEIIELETSQHILTIRFRKFFGTEKEFNFELNCKSIDGCKTDKTALKKIQQFIDKGFSIFEM
jgi:hypothetical protein